MDMGGGRRELLGVYIADCVYVPTPGVTSAVYEDTLERQGGKMHDTHVLTLEIFVPYIGSASVPREPGTSLPGQLPWDG